MTFDDGGMTELNANLIAQSMYTQCDPDGNQYVLLDSIIDYQCLDMAIRLADRPLSDPMGKLTNDKIPLAGNFAANGKTVLPLGRT